MSNYNNTGKTIDVRGVMARVEALEGERDRADECGLCHGALGPVETFANPEPHVCVDCGGTGKAGIVDWAAECAEDAEELDRLTELLTDLAGAGGDEQWRGDWYPGALIADADGGDWGYR
jgi:hypothetical protein